MKKNILVTSIFISLFLNCLAQEQPAEYYAMKYFPYSPYGVTTEQLESFYKNDSSFIRDSSIQIPHILFQFKSNSITNLITGSNRLSVYFGKAKLLRGVDTFQILSYDIMYFFSKSLTLEEIKEQVNLIKKDFKKRYPFSIETVSKHEAKPKTRILIVKNKQFSTGDVTISDGHLKDDPLQYFLNFSVILLPENLIKKDL